MKLAAALAFCLALSTTRAFSPLSHAFLPRQTLVRLLATAEGASKSILKRLPESAVEVTLTIPGAATQAAYDKACGEVSKKISIPGFRKGARIPPKVLEQSLAAEGGRTALREEAIRSLLAQLIEPAIKEDHGLEPIGRPTLVTPAEELAQKFEPGEPLALGVKCDVWPDISWKGDNKPYMGLSATYKRKPPNQEKLDTALKDLRDRYARLEPLEAGAELAMGDACVVNMEGFMAQADGSKGEPLPNAASGDHVEIVLGKGRYMEGLVEGLIGAKVGDTCTVTVSFPTKLKDKTLAGKKAVFDVTVLEASLRTLPEVTDEFAEQVRAGLTAKSLLEELSKAVDEEDSKAFVGARNAALATALADVLDVEVPDTLVTQQAHEKFTVMMTEMRDNGVPDEEIKRQIKPENFLKYKSIVKDDVVKDFRVSMAIDEIARLEGIEVDDSQVEEQLQAIKKDAGDEFDETMMRLKVEGTIQRQLVMDFLAKNANLDVEYVEEGQTKFDEELLNKLAEESLERERELAEKAEAEEGETLAPTAQVLEAQVVEPKTESVQKDDPNASIEDKAYKALMDSGMVEVSPDPASPDYDSSRDDEFVS